QAQNQSKKSILNRIERAKRGIPTAGSLPFGRTWDKAKQQWQITAGTKEMLLDIATEYLKGESLPKLARKYKMNQSHLHRVLREKCGPVWTQKFETPAWDFPAVVPTPVPELLPATIIKECQVRCVSRRSIKRGRPSATHGLSRYVFCGHCGQTLLS